MDIIMNLNFKKEDLIFQEEVRDFINDNLNHITKKKMEEGYHLTKEDMVNWYNKLSTKGWMAPNWPKAYGGTDWTVTQRFIFNNECAEAYAPDGEYTFGVTMVGPVIIKYGTEEQKKYYLPKILSNTHWWCQGYSEPGSGSDLASLSTKAEKVEGGYKINGTKTWTTMAHFADMMFILVRTNSDCKPQEGISFMLLDMKSPGVSVKPIITLDGSHYINMVYLEDVFIPHKNLIYEENKGWTVAKYLLGHERTNNAQVASSKKALSKIRKIAKLKINGTYSLSEDKRFIDKLANCDLRVQALEYDLIKVISNEIKGISPGVEANMLKIRGSEIQQEITELVLEASGYYANSIQNNIIEIGMNEPKVGPSWTSTSAQKYFDMRKTTIYAGSTEIQKNILAKMVLEL
jgi:alkylation response protein AidB-like acyl-CoA dehydrogenase|tara:strand:+ start:479 stop:1690 length:1212 start_codon:yes stop_codon:yes gene_type:complete